MKRKVQLKGQLRRYVQWPLILSVLLLVMNLVMYFVSVKAGCVMSGFLIVYIAVVLLLYVKNRPQIYGELVSFATQYGQVQRKLLKELAIPYALLDEDGRVLWGNTAFFAGLHKQPGKMQGGRGIASNCTKHSQHLPVLEKILCNNI